MKIQVRNIADAPIQNITHTDMGRCYVDDFTLPNGEVITIITPERNALTAQDRQRYVFDKLRAKGIVVVTIDGYKPEDL